MEDKEGATEVLASGLVHLLQPVVQQCDLRTQMVLDSQHQLSTQLSALSAELDKLQAHNDTPSLMPYVNKIVSARKRLGAVAVQMQTVKARVANIDKQRAAIRQLTAAEEVASPTESAEASGATAQAASGATAEEPTKDSDAKPEQAEAAPEEPGKSDAEDTAPAAEEPQESAKEENE